MSTDRFADYGRPRRVDGGLRARSARGAIGRSWWSRRFLEVLESFALGTRLTRGRSYARAGQVLRLDIAPGRVSAEVQGSRPRPYEVSIALSPFPAALWTRIEEELAGQAFFSARLLAGDLPDELEELFVTAGAPLFPTGVDELTQRCNCPDFAVPCKHLAATFYLLAEAFDADPFELLHWRGRSRTQLLDALRARRAEATGTPAPPGPSALDIEPSLVDTTPAGTARALTGLSAALMTQALDRFWSPPVPLPDRPPRLATGPDLLLRQLGPPAPSIGGPGLLERLRRAYRAFGPADR
ncbi:SWIM zinc finger family protein [Micromonospora sp. WMMD710]|uniref:SWIM zinc finger family protein n=1 Tax=Micromonospora sp. WMMD710 TaxID=3016085 RepID=UPI00241791F9|nr:SWIM zinc finger family protein [Micromonospora sp. WMMD710]MDG4756738.1 SWIM zinc finger family protein [Micromonospora sp. WMMD710]